MNPLCEVKNCPNEAVICREIRGVNWLACMDCDAATRMKEGDLSKPRAERDHYRDRLEIAERLIHDQVARAESAEQALAEAEKDRDEWKVRAESKLYILKDEEVHAVPESAAHLLQARDAMEEIARYWEGKWVVAFNRAEQAEEKLAGIREWAAVELREAEANTGAMWSSRAQALRQVLSLFEGGRESRGESESRGDVHALFVCPNDHIRGADHYGFDSSPPQCPDCDDEGERVQMRRVLAVWKEETADSLTGAEPAGDDSPDSARADSSDPPSRCPNPHCENGTVYGDFPDGAGGSKRGYVGPCRHGDCPSSPQEDK